MEISVETFDKICRVCLIQSTELKSLCTKLDGEDRSLHEILAFTANINFKIEDILPKQVCSDCESIMCKADAFKRRCHESESILNKVYQNAAGCGVVASVDQDRPIKAEKSDIKQKLSEYGTLVSPVASNSGYKDVFDKKNIPIQDFSIPSTVSVHFDKFPDLKGKQPVKQESVNNFDDDNDYLDHFEDGIQIEIVPIEHTPKVEKKVKKENNKASRPKKRFAIRYECYCHKQFTNKVEYNAHLKEKQCDAFTMFGKGCSNIVNGKLQCTKCDKSFNSSTALKVHIRTHRKELDDNETTELFQCSLCLRKFKNKMSLAAHIQRHEEMDGIKHVCQICKREFKYKAYLENHLLTVHSKTFGLTCEICTESFNNKIDLEAHKKTHENDKKHSCTICNKSFFMLCTLKEHIRTHTGEKPFLCSQCGKGFSQKTNLAQHTRRHQGLKPFKCDSCEKRFVSKGELDAHTRKHSGAHPFRCDDCGNGFTTSSALVKHRRTHTGERPYQCDLCPMRFAASGTLKNHRRTHTGERPFQCSYCEKAFVQRNDLISHIRCHTGERPYICTQCGQSFRKASGLKTHVKMHIKDPIVGVNALLTSLHCTNEQ